MLKLLIIAFIFYSPVSETDEIYTHQKNPEYTGIAACKTCHSKEVALWQNSHHDLAMQIANEETVLGDFSNRAYEYAGTKSVFLKKDNHFYVRTDGADGKLAEFEIKYTFGIYPLQQYLIEIPGGRLQAFTIAWDTRPKQEQGQRWFHLYPDEQVTHTHLLHWTGLRQNWNLACAECHSTDLRKNYDAATNNYQTSWSDLDVSCEACHGPGSKHVAWASNATDSNSLSANNGLAIHLEDSHLWKQDKQTGNAKRSPVKKSSDAEITTCARCHSRRSNIWGQYQHGSAFLDHYVPSTLEAGLYTADGQADDEVYVYGSFLQSKMYRQGVICSDCHEPHSLKLKAEGNQLCSRCHSAKNYATEKHHFHPLDSTSSLCVSCHMPVKNIMQIDQRHDHSFRIPRPDLSLQMDTPNVCTTCHKGKNNQWAQTVLEQWYGKEKSPAAHFATALDAGRQGIPDAHRLLLLAANNTAYPTIAKATAITLLSQYPGADTYAASQQYVQHTDPKIRLASLDIIDTLPSQLRIKLAAKLLNDPVRAVRIRAASTIAGNQQLLKDKTLSKHYETSIGEYLHSLQENLDDPASLTNLANYYRQTSAMEKAETHYQAAIRIERFYIPAYLNLADIYRQQNQDNKAEPLINTALSLMPDTAELYHAYGLLLIRTDRQEKALAMFKKASDLDAENAYLKYVLCAGTG